MANILFVGATSAIAGELIRRYSEAGDRLYLLARNEDKLATLLATLSSAPQGYAHADFNDTDQAEALIELAWNTLGSIDLVIFAHGYIGDQLLSEANYQHAEDIIRSNFLSSVALLIPLAKRMQQAGHGKIAVMTSVAGDRGRPRNYTYGAAKGALDLYLQGMRSVLWHSGVEIYSFKLGPVVTPMTTSHRKNFSFSSIDAVADRMQARLKGRRYTSYIPAFWFWVMLAVRWMPEPVFQRLRFLSGR